MTDNMADIEDITPSQSDHGEEYSEESEDLHSVPKQGPPKLTEVCFLLQSRYAGMIIGKGGENIAKLRQEYKATLFLPDCRGPERILSIVIENDLLPALLKEIIPIMQDCAALNNENTIYDVRMLLHQDYIGRVIGKGGSMIKSLRENTTSEITIFRECCPSSTERVAQICGKLNSIINCVIEITDLIADAPIRIPKVLYDPHNYNPVYFSLYGGYSVNSRSYVANNRQSFSNNFRETRGAQMGRSRTPENVLPYPRIIRSTSNRVLNCSGQSDEAPPVGRSWIPKSRSFRRTNWPNNDGDNPQLPASISAEFKQPECKFEEGQRDETVIGDSLPKPSAKEKELDYNTVIKLFDAAPIFVDDCVEGQIVITIPSVYIGSIIGYCGENIRNIRQVSDCDILIDRPPKPGNAVRCITIKGPLEKIIVAQTLLKKSLSRNVQK